MIVIDADLDKGPDGQQGEQGAWEHGEVVTVTEEVTDNFNDCDDHDASQKLKRSDHQIRREFGFGFDRPCPFEMVATSYYLMLPRICQALPGRSAEISPRSSPFARSLRPSATALSESPM